MWCKYCWWSRCYVWINICRWRRSEAKRVVGWWSTIIICNGRSYCCCFWTLLLRTRGSWRRRVRFATTTTTKEGITVGWGVLLVVSHDWRLFDEISLCYQKGGIGAKEPRELKMSTETSPRHGVHVSEIAFTVLYPITDKLDTWRTNWIPIGRFINVSWNWPQEAAFLTLIVLFWVAPTQATSLSPSIFQDTSRLSAVPGRAQQYSVQFYNLASIAARHCLIMYFASREELIKSELELDKRNLLS